MDFIGYDFDKTIYQGDSSAQFTLWCLSRYPILRKNMQSV